MDDQDRAAFITQVTTHMMGRYAAVREFILFAGELRIYVGSDEHGDAPPPTVIHHQAQAFAAALEAPDDPSDTIPNRYRTVAGATLMRCLYGSDEVPREFWGTVVGTQVAMAIGYNRPICPFGVAAVILNVSRQRISQMVQEGRLRGAQFAGGGELGVLPSSIRAELLTHGRRA